MPKTNAGGDVDPSYYSALTVVNAGGSDQALREQAIAELPLQGLPGEARAKAAQVVTQLALFRRLPTLEFAVDPQAYQYLLTHPDVAVSSWRAMEISQFELRPTGKGVYHADARDGSVGTVEVWKSTPEETLIYCDGAFKSPLLVKPIIARSIMRLRTRYFNAANGEPRAEHTGDVFVSFPSQTVEAVARLISPLSHMIADRNFKQLSLYVHLMSAAMARQPAWVQSIVRRMDADPAHKQELLTVAAAVRQASERRAETALSVPLPVDDILAPLRQEADIPTVVPAAAQQTDLGSVRR